MDDKWTWRDTVASWIHRFGYKCSPGVPNDILIRDADGTEIFSIAFEGGFVASGPSEPYTAHSREWSDDDIPTITEW